MKYAFGLSHTGSNPVPNDISFSSTPCCIIALVSYIGKVSLKARLSHIRSFSKLKNKDR